MIGPSSTINSAATTSKRKMNFDDIVDIDLSLCDDFLSTSNTRKRYVQEQIAMGRQIVYTPQSQHQSQNQQEQSPMNIPTVVVVVDDQPSDTDFSASYYSPPMADATTMVYSNSSANEKIDPVNRLGVLFMDNDDVDTTRCAWTMINEVNENRYRRSPTFLTLEHSNVSKNNEKTESLVDTNKYDNDDGHEREFGRISNADDYAESFDRENITTRTGLHGTGETNREQEMDQDNGNLSWLLDFKLDSLIEAADDRCTVKGTEMVFGNSNKGSKLNKNFVYADNAVRQWLGHMPADSVMNATEDITSAGICPRQQSITTDRRFNDKLRSDRPKKPPFTYTELIEHALQEKGELTVSAIYQWISEHFPYYKSNDDRWKNSVRHNLSINPHFRKGSKAPHGAGHLWAIANPNDTKPRSIIGNAMTSSAYRSCNKNNEENHQTSGNDSCHLRFMDEVEVATASIIPQPSSNEPDNIIHSVSLEHCAEQILSGIKKQVEVQYLVPMMVTDNGEHDVRSHQEQTNINGSVKESDFLNPVSKEVVAEECGLLSEGYLVTDLNPTTLGLNMVEHEMITQDTLFGEDLSFQFYELTTPSATTSQIQSA